MQKLSFPALPRYAVIFSMRGTLVVTRFGKACPELFTIIGGSFLATASFILVTAWLDDELEAILYKG